MLNNEFLHNAIANNDFDMYLKWLDIDVDDLEKDILDTHVIDFKGLRFSYMNLKALPSEYLAYRLGLLSEYASKHKLENPLLINES